jgi:peptidoglycan/LPS O-acetylase OafA/YrhL
LWSLSYEFWYYIFFPLLIAVLSRSKQTSVRVKIGLLLALLLAMSGWKIGAYFLIWLMGAGVACLPLRLPRRMRGISTAVAGFILVAAMTLALRLPINLFFAEFAIGAAFSLFLWVVLHAQEVSVHPLYRTSAQTLSGMSYTLYLSHYPMLLLLSALILPTRQLWAVSAFSLLKVVSILSIVFAASWLVYYCFERNTPAIRNWLRMQLEVRRAHVAR